MTIQMTYEELTEQLKAVIGDKSKINDLVKVVDRETSAPVLITPLMMAVLNYDVSSVRLLLQNGADIGAVDKELESGGGRTALHYAARFGNEPIVAELVASHASVDAIDNYGATPLYYACNFGHIGTVRFILEHGANPNGVRRDESKSALRECPLVAAAKREHITVVDILLDAGADPNVTDSTKRTPLIYAARKHNTSLIQRLLSKKVDIGRVDKYGENALMHAALGNNQAVDTIALLVEAGADISKKDKHGRTAVDKLKMVIEFIERAGKKKLPLEE